MAKKWGLSQRRVRTIVAEEYARLGEVRADLAQEQAQVISDRLDALALAYMDDALSGDLKAAELVLKLADRHARLLGLDKPVKVQSQVTNLGMNLSDLREQAAALGLVVPTDDERLLTNEKPVPVEIEVKSVENSLTYDN